MPGQDSQVPQQKKFILRKGKYKRVNNIVKNYIFKRLKEKKLLTAYYYKKKKRN